MTVAGSNRWPWSVSWPAWSVVRELRALARELREIFPGKPRQAVAGIP